jgi:hypothetical protein
MQSAASRPKHYSGSSAASKASSLLPHCACSVMPVNSLFALPAQDDPSVDVIAEAAEGKEGDGVH